MIKTICVGSEDDKRRAINGLDGLVRSRLRRTAISTFRVSFERADELTQDALIRAIKAACSFSGAGGGWGWVLKIAERLFLSEQRKSKRQAPIDQFQQDEDGVDKIPEPPGHIAAEHAREEAMLRLIEDAMDVLAVEDSAKALALHEYVSGNWSVEDLAQFTGAKAPYQYVYAAKEKLRRICARLMREGALE